MLTKIPVLKPAQVYAAKQADGSYLPYEIALTPDSVSPIIVCETLVGEDQTTYKVYLNHQLETIVRKGTWWYIIDLDCPDWLQQALCPYIAESAPEPSNDARSPLELAYDKLQRWERSDATMW